MLERNTPRIKEKIARFAYFVLATNHDYDREDILTKYRNKDQVEKVFDLLKTKWMGQD